MHFVTQQRQQQQQQHKQTQQQKSTTTTNRFVSLCKSSSQGALPKSLATAQSPLRQSSQQQQQQQPRHKRAASLTLHSMRDSIGDDITTATTTTTATAATNSINGSQLSSKLLTIQEAAGTLERGSSIALATALSSAQATSAPVVAVIYQETQISSNSSSNSSSNNTNNSNGCSNNNSHQNVEPPSPQAANTPSISISQAESKEQQQQHQQQQSLLSQSLDSNGQQAGSCTDSPSSRKSSTSSKGKSAKLSTSSSGRDEDAQSKISESNSTEGVLLRGDPTASDKPNKGTSRLSERAKKKSWYNVIYPNYKSRAEDFKKLFKDVPNDERLIVDYSCALQRDILVQGRLYVSQNYVCFHANIFSWETYVSIKWKDVTAITKEKTALVIPNAITISTAKEKFFFATFASRDKSYLMLFRVWQNTLLNKQFSPQEIWRYVHNSYGEELGLTTDDEDYIDPTLDADTETDVDFQTAIDDFGGDQSLCSQSTNNSGQLQQQQQSGNSSASSGGGSAAVRKSKTKYFFNSSKSSNLNSSANASASGSDNKASDSTRKSNKKMKANAKELTLSSVKAAEQSVAVTISVPSGNSNISNSHGHSNSTTTASTTSTAATATTATANTTASGSAKAEKVSSNASLATAPELQSHGSDAKRKVQMKNQRQRDAELAVKNNEAGPTDVSDSSDSEVNNAPFVPSTECTSTHEGRQIVHTILPIRVDTLFNFLFSKSKFLTDFHEQRKSTDLSLGEWHKNEEGQNVRVVNVTVQLAASVGPKTSKVTEYQTMRECSKPGELYSIDVNSVNAGIPYADSFSVLIHFCLARTVDDHTMLSVHAQIKYKKSIWGMVKGFIEKNTWAGLEDFFGAQLHALQSETCIPPAKGKGRRPRRGILVTATATTTTTTTASSTDYDKQQQHLQHHHHHPHHQHPHHHHHHHHHRHHHHHHPHHHPHHHHPHHHLQHQQQLPASPQQHLQIHPQQQIHRKAKLLSCSGTSTQSRGVTEESNSGGASQGCLPDSMDNWDSKLQSGAAGGLAHGAAGGSGGASGKQQQLTAQQLLQQQQQQQLLAGGLQVGRDRFRHRGLSLFVILLMCLLLALNVILLLKLWKLEEHIDLDLSRRARMPTLAALKELPSSNQDWLELMRQQELSHESELRKWHQVLQTAIELLKKTEKTLAEVMIP
ncbi:protein Aster-B isoform X4 [Drosophila navojoa]|uniref:protein Aster-B isoform X4 n=1 Tax=Drosophila navojoa TaxID=7232 RepID=UPI0008473148|nr:protein Aster-B isoform X4 [Drosophila navojoa]